MAVKGYQAMTIYYFEWTLGNGNMTDTTASADCFKETGKHLRNHISSNQRLYYAGTE